jgi:hypothetical protein
MCSHLNEPQGYSSAAYLTALGQTPLPLGETGGFVTRRAIGATRQTDLSGAWPIFTCQNWSILAKGIAAIAPGPASLTLVSDPFAPLSQTELAAIFPVCRPLHDHWIVNLSAPSRLSKHHRRALRNATDAQITAGPASPDLAEGWAAVYAHLVAKKQIRDSRAFSASALAAQLAVPGGHVVSAWDRETLLGVDLYYLDRGRAFAHLSAYSPQGYAVSVSYPMMAAAIDYFAPLAEAIDLGGAPGGSAGPGIAQFKAGWTPLTRPTYLCGKVLDRKAYDRLAPDAESKGWFPAYRAGEFLTGS